MVMLVYDIIRTKRDGRALSKEQIEFFVRGYTLGQIPDYQAAALLMAIYLRGCTEQELTALTLAMAHSGDKIDGADLPGIKVDKHSTGGVGDKTTLVCAPIAAACGVTVAKMSGRGLGFTGGTVDKLQSIPHYRTELTKEQFYEIVRETRLSVISQTGNLAPADKKLYALRDVTATVESLPLIASSIMSKKLASGADCLLLDVKTGSGALMRRFSDAEELARQMVGIGTAAGKGTAAVVTNMDEPLGDTVGNALEVAEAADTLRGKGPWDLTGLSLVLAAHMIFLAQRMGKADGPAKADFKCPDRTAEGVMARYHSLFGDEVPQAYRTIEFARCFARAERALRDGSAFGKLKEMVTAHGGDISVLDDPSRFPPAKRTEVLFAPQDGFIQHIDTDGIGMASLLLGAGRQVIEQQIDPAAGIRFHCKTGGMVERGQPVATLYAQTDDRLAQGKARFLDSVHYGQKPPTSPLVLSVLS